MALTGQEVTNAIHDLGWRLVLGRLSTHVAVRSVAAGAEVAALVAGVPTDDRLQIDIRADGVLLSVRTSGTRSLTGRDVVVARAVTRMLTDNGFRTDVGGSRAPQSLEIAVDAMDIPLIRPFWQAVLGYVEEIPGSGPDGALADPLGQGPAVWFQQMDQPRPQRNRIHLDISVPHDEAPGRIERTLAAGGRLLSDAEAPAFWVLADAEGNEVCITTWQGRD
ncbi:MAG TPA: VOC family protein [Pseudonocardiaceae bacterium]|nr:VOC family protein [Pseudonocardiaceae bacterium]